MFICTSNNKSKIPKPLYDRMSIFQFKSYSEENKRIIASQYILPRLCEQYSFNISLDKEAIAYLCKGINLREIERRLTKIISSYIFASYIHETSPPETLGVNDIKKLNSKKIQTKRQLGF